jgi:hypothetical protein
MKKDYPELEGKEINVIIGWVDGTIENIKGIVVGCNYDIGMTIKNADPKSSYKYLLCGTGPSSPLWKPQFDLQLYKKSFNNFVRQVQKGEIDISQKANPNIPNTRFKPELHSENCSYGQ